jgi:SAM-dependent methyltransferase
MKFEETWRPTKFSLKNGQLLSNKKYVGVGSHYITSRLAPVYSKMIRTYARGDLADVGCGMVPLYGLYRSYVSSVTCFDWDASLHRSPYVDKFVNLSETIPCDNMQFDTVIATDVVAHIFDCRRLYSEVHRILRGGGHFIIGSPFFYWINEAPADYHRFTKYAYLESLKAAGFEVCEIIEYGGLPDIFIDLISKALMRRKIMSRVWAYLAIALGKINLLRRFADNTKAQFPLGYVIVARRA